jgi:hypothetical protein
MDEPSRTDTRKSPALSRRDRWVKLGFVAVLSALAIVIYYYQRGGLSLPGWGDDLDEALAQAHQENRLVLALFVSDPPGELARQLAKKTIQDPINTKAIQDGRYVTVIVTVDTALQSRMARTCGLKSLPTLLLLGPKGEERNRREGMVGEVPFRQGFLDCTDVMRPGP